MLAVRRAIHPSVLKDIGGFGSQNIGGRCSMLQAEELGFLGAGLYYPTPDRR